MGGGGRAGTTHTHTPAAPRSAGLEPVAGARPFPCCHLPAPAGHRRPPRPPPGAGPPPAPSPPAAAPASKTFASALRSAGCGSGGEGCPNLLLQGGARHQKKAGNFYLSKPSHKDRVGNANGGAGGARMNLSLT